MHLALRPYRLQALLLGCLTLLTTHLTAQVQIDYTDGQTDATSHDTSSVLTLSILSGTATQSGVLFGSDRVLKVGAGTLILSGVNTYTNDTVVHGGTLQVVTGTNMSQAPANIFVADVSGDIGTLLISGGTVGSSSGYIGTHAGSTGTVTVTAGTWTNSDTLYLGNEGTGVLNLSGGTLSSSTALVGYASGSSGTANVSGGTWTNSANIEVGYGGSGVMNITGGSVTSANGYLGSNLGSSGTVNITAGSWAITDNLYIAHNTTGVVNLSGGSVSAQIVYEGLNAGGSGTLNVSSGTLTNNTSYFLGYSGSGVLNLSGGSISNAASSVGFDVGGSGAANVSGGTWTNNSSLVLGESGTGVLNLSGGSVIAQVVYEGLNAGSSGTLNVSGGSLTNNTSYFLGSSGSGVLNLSGGSITNISTSVATYAGSSGTANVSGGSWTNNGSLVIGESGTGVLNLSGGSISNTSADVGLNEGSRGTANVSGGSWTSSGDLTIGDLGTGVLNLTGSGVVSVGVEGGGTLNLGYDTGSHGTLNLGTGGTAGTLYAATVIGNGSGEDGQAVVNFNHTGNYTFAPKLDGFMDVNQIGVGTSTFTQANTYSGVTSVLGGTLELAFGSVSQDILPVSSDLILGSGTLLLSGSGTQSLPSISTRDNSAGSIVLGSGETLAIGALNSAGQSSALNFNTAAGGVITLTGQTSGAVINPGFTVTDSNGFGLATVNAGDQVIRLTSAPLLPAVGALSGTDYLINNGSGDGSTAGSAQLQINDSATVHSITVDTTATAGSLTLGVDATLSTDVWNFGGAGSGHEYSITGAALTTATAGGTLQINNYNATPITIAAPFLDNGGTTLLFQGTGSTVLTSNDNNVQNLVVTSGGLVIRDGGSLYYDSTATIGSQTGDNAVLTINAGNLLGTTGVIGDGVGAMGTVEVQAGSYWALPTGDLTIGNSGIGVLNTRSGGSLMVQNVFLGVNAGASGTATVDYGGNWYVSSGLYIGEAGTGVMNLTGGTISVASGIGTVTLGAQGVLNIGTGASAGLLQAGKITGASGSVVNFNYSSYSHTSTFSTPLTGDLSVTKSGGGSLQFTSPNTYTGGTTINSGTVFLVLGFRSSNYLSPLSALTMGGGTFNVFGGGTQTLNGLSTLAGTGGYIHLASNTTLNLGALTSLGSGSALNFDVSSGEADGSTVGSSIVTLTGQTPGAAINPGFTVIDSTGFGLAAVNADNQIIRLTDSDRLPHVGSDPGKDYLVDNSDTESDQPGSSRLFVSASETARSVTVDTDAAAGTLTLGSGTVLSSDVWNFGSYGAHNYEIKTDGDGAGISTATPGGMLQINNYNGYVPVIISAPILDNEGSGVRVAGTGITFLNGSNTYTGETVLNSGTLYINGDESAATGSVTVQSAATLSGTGTLGGSLIVQNGGIVSPGSFLGTGTLNGTTATFATSSIFHVLDFNGSFTSLHLTGSITIAPGALLYMDVITPPTLSSYTLLSAASGLDGSTPFTLGDGLTLPSGYKLVYTGTALELDVIPTSPAVAYWTGKVDSNWSSLTSGTTNWATAADGLTDTFSLPGSPTDVTFSATGVGPVTTNLDLNFTVNSLTVDSDTIINTTGTQTLTVNTTTAVNALLAINSGVTLIGNGTLTIDTAGTLAGSGSVQMAADTSIIANGAISVGDGTNLSGQALSLTTSGTGSIVMGADSSLHLNLYSGAGLGDSTATPATADLLNLHGTLDATAGGTLVLGNPHAMTAYAGGDQWKVVDLNSGAGAITGHLALNDSSLGLATGFIGSFDQTTGIYSIADHRPEMTAQSSGLPMANAEGQSIISGVQTSTNDVNNHLFNLRSGGGEEDSDGSIASSIDDGVVVGQGDGPESPIAKRIKRTRQWEVFTTVNYGNVRLNPISNQSGVQIDSWASSVGIERHLSRGLTLGFAATFLQSHQTYTGGLGNLHLEGPTLSTYLAYVKKSFWGSLLYSFGDYDLGSQRNPGLGLPVASGATSAYTNAIQYNTGWNFRFQNNTLVTGPFAGIDYLHGTVDSYTETGGGAGALHYSKQTFQSLVTRVGWSASKKIETDWATITPQLRLSYERQNVRNNGTSVNLINAPFSANGGNQTPGQDYMVIGTGVNFQFSAVFNMLLGYQTQIFRNNMTAHFGSIRFGYKF